MRAVDSAVSRTIEWSWSCRARTGLRRRFDEQRDFAANAVAGGQVAAHYRQTVPRRNSSCILVSSRASDDAQRRTPDGFEIGQRLENPVRGFVKDQGARRIRRGSAARASRRVRRAPAFSGKKSDEVKLVGGQAGGHQRAERRIGAGNGNDGDAGGDGFGGQPAAGVADAGHAGVGDHGDARRRL